MADDVTRNDVKAALKNADEVFMEVESEVSDIIEAAKSACRKAKSIGEMRRIKRLSNEKIRFLSQLLRKEDYS